MRKYKKRPVVVEAIQWDGKNIEEVKEFVAEDKFIISPFSNKITGQVENMLLVKTLEGEMIASPGDFIIKGIEGEFYPCSPDVFEKTYEIVESDGKEN